MLHGIRCERNVPYVRDNTVDHTLDIWTPKKPERPLPVLFYVHGGAFRICSKESHWIMALIHARRGFLVFNINYRLAPKNRYPAAVKDVATALRWVHENAARYGGNPDRIILAGESAGANLVTSMALARSIRQEEPWAADLFDRPIPIRAVMAACGIFQVTDSERFGRTRPKMSSLTKDILGNVARNYLPHQHYPAGTWPLADPLVTLEESETLERPLPAIFAPVGTKDPILDDTRRLHKALQKHGVDCEAPIYEGELHAFHAMFWRKKARECWASWFDFLKPHL
jgi:acetyl esterase